MAKKVQNEELFFLLFKSTHLLFTEAFFFFSRSWGYRSEQITYPRAPYIVREVTDVEHVDKCLQQYVI